MRNSNNAKALYTEIEAAHSLGISLAHLKMVLDENIFNDGSARPAEVLLQPSDLVLVEFWIRRTANPKVVRMPKRAR